MSHPCETCSGPNEKRACNGPNCAAAQALDRALRSAGHPELSPLNDERIITEPGSEWERKEQS